MQVQLVEALRADDVDVAFSKMAHDLVDGLIVLLNPMLSVQRQLIVERAARQRLPAVYEATAFVESGGLISYGAEVPDVYRRTARLVDKILRGANPGDIPVEGANALRHRDQSQDRECTGADDSRRHCSASRTCH